MDFGIGKGFVRKQEVRLAVRLLEWKYQNAGRTVPTASELNREAERVVDEAHAIAKERGTNVLEIIRETVADIRKGKS